MKAWLDATNSPHVLVFTPLIRRLRQRGWDVAVTARSFAQTEELFAMCGIGYELIGEHGGRNLFRKGARLLSRTRAMIRYGRENGPFDLAFGHGSNDLAIAARLLGIPQVTSFDYEHARLQHSINCRCADAVLVPEAISRESIGRYGVGPAKYRTYPGLKEEYYLADRKLDAGILDSLGLDPGKVVAVVRTPADVSLYHRGANPVHGLVLERLGREAGVQAVVVPRTPEQAAGLRALDLPNLFLPERAVDAVSLIAAADLVVGAGGTMNREAVALGTPVYSTFSQKLGAVDEALFAAGRMVRIEGSADVDAIPLVKKPSGVTPVLRDPEDMLERILGAVGLA